MEFLPEKISQYIESHSEAESDLLSALNRETHLKVLTPRMLSGHLQGRVLSMLSKMIKPERILEIGTYTGYSALCLAEGLQSNGVLESIDRNEELKPIIDKYWNQSDYKDQLVHITGNALEIIPTLDNMYDIVFIDADKENYSNYFDLVIDKTKTGGYIIADNVLWSGNVVQEESEMINSTKAIVEFNKKVHEDSRVENVLFPVRDGLMVLRKK